MFTEPTALKLVASVSIKAATGRMDCVGEAVRRVGRAPIVYRIAPLGCTVQIASYVAVAVSMKTFVMLSPANVLVHAQMAGRVKSVIQGYLNLEQPST